MKQSKQTSNRCVQIQSKILTKAQKQFNGERNLFNKWYYLKLYTKINLKWIIGPNIKAKTTKLLGKKYRSSQPLDQQSNFKEDTESTSHKGKKWKNWTSSKIKPCANKKMQEKKASYWE